MPYITNAQKEWAGWCDLSSAVHQICTADSCNEASAVQQLRLAIADGNVRVSWADRPMHYVDEPVFDSITPPTNRWWWLHYAKIDLDAEAWPDEDGPVRNGLVQDDWCLAPLYLGTISRAEGSPVEKWAAWDWIEEARKTRLQIVFDARIRFRPLLVWRLNLDAIWGGPRPTAKSSGDKGADLPVRRSAPDSQIEQFCREMYAQHCDDPPNVNRAYELARKKFPHTSRKKIRDDILRRPEFAALRRRAGIRRAAPGQAR